MNKFKKLVNGRDGVDFRSKLQRFRQLVVSGEFLICLDARSGLSIASGDGTRENEAVRVTMVLRVVVLCHDQSADNSEHERSVPEAIHAASFVLGEIWKRKCLQRDYSSHQRV